MQLSDNTKQAMPGFVIAILMVICGFIGWASKKPRPEGGDWRSYHEKHETDPAKKLYYELRRGE